MSGTKIGGMRAAATNKKLYGIDFYKNIGSKGGHNGHTGGFASNPALARVAGAKGGRASRKTGGGKYCKILKENEDRIKDMLESGLWTRKDIADIMGVPAPCFYYFIRKNGLEE